MNTASQDPYYSLKLTLAFGATYIIWGTSYLANVFALKGFTPFVLVTFRYFIAGSLLSIYALCKKLEWPSLHDTKVIGLSGILMLGLGSGMVAFAQLYIGSGYAAAVTATEPLWFVLLDRKRWPYYFSNLYVTGGLLAGFGGITYFSYLSTNGHSGHWLGTFVILIAAIFWVVGTLFMQYNMKGKPSTITVTAVQLFAASGFAFIAGFVRGEWADFRLHLVPKEGWAGLFYLIVMGSLIAFLAYNWLVRVQPPAIVSTSTYVNPIVAIFMGWLVAGEQITVMQCITFAFVLISVLVVQLKKPKFNNQ